MTIPYHMGALLPIQDRYTNLAFRRVSIRFRSRRLDYDDAIELAAFLAVCPVKTCAKYVFQWDRYGERAGQAVAKLMEVPAADFARENISKFTPEDGRKLLDAMRDGGWTTARPMPPFVRRSVMEVAHNRGRRFAADVYGLGVAQVHALFNRSALAGSRKGARAAVAISVS